MNSVVHFEMPYDDQTRMSSFYEQAFGWQMKAFGEEMGNYVLATTTESDERGGSVKPGAINGGFFPKKPDWPAQYPSVVIAVDSITDAMEQVRRAGGTVMGEPMEILSDSITLKLAEQPTRAIRPKRNFASVAKVAACLSQAANALRSGVSRLIYRKSNRHICLDRHQVQAFICPKGQASINARWRTARHR
ncbi:MAG TPA: VOC family protein [Rhodocyclaceae bacterium]|nr:VOC family protein [Rhodocyclaceae bacterium]